MNERKKIRQQRLGNKKVRSRADNRFKWTPNSIQSEILIIFMFWNRDGNPLPATLRVVENPLGIILIPITVRTEEFANFFMTLKVSRKLNKWENQKLDDLLDYMEKILGRFKEVSQINILHAPDDL